MLRAGSALILALTSVGCGKVLGIEETRYEKPRDYCTLVAERVYFADKVDADMNLTVGVTPVGDLLDIAEAFNVVLDDARGHAVVTLLDCQDAPLEDAALGVAPPATGLTQLVVNAAGPELGQDTSELGTLALLNLPAQGEIQLSALPQPIEPRASSIGDIVPAAGELSRITLRPNSEVTTPGDSSPALSCVGAIPEPATSATSVAITVDVVQTEAFVPNGVPVVGARVRACADAQGECGDAAFTDTAGRAVLAVPVTDGKGFDGQILVDGSECGGG